MAKHVADFGFDEDSYSFNDSRLQGNTSSSGYGRRVPGPKPEPMPYQDPEATFEPQLPKRGLAARLRQMVQSSGYGRKLPQPPATREMPHQAPARVAQQQQKPKLKWSLKLGRIIRLAGDKYVAEEEQQQQEQQQQDEEEHDGLEQHPPATRGIAWGGFDEPEDGPGQNGFHRGEDEEEGAENGGTQGHGWGENTMLESKSIFGLKDKTKVIEESSMTRDARLAAAKKAREEAQRAALEEVMEKERRKLEQQARDKERRERENAARAQIIAQRKEEHARRRSAVEGDSTAEDAGIIDDRAETESLASAVSASTNNNNYNSSSNNNARPSSSQNRRGRSGIPVHRPASRDGQSSNSSSRGSTPTRGASGSRIPLARAQTADRKSVV